MQKQDFSNIKPGPKNSPILQYMEKKITVRMLEAHFNALPELLRYVIAKADNDINARIALNNFTVAARKERPSLDPCEAVFGFASNILRLGEDAPEELDDDKKLIAQLASEFCKVNELGMPEDGWTERLKIVKP